MPRAIWSGAIAFGLVSVPVRMYSAIEQQDLRFHLVHEPGGGRIGYALKASVAAAKGTTSVRNKPARKTPARPAKR